MAQLKLHARQLLSEVLHLMEEDRSNSMLIYTDHRFVGKISNEELRAFLEYKNDVKGLYEHKLNIELGVVLTIVRGMRGQAYIKAKQEAVAIRKSRIRSFSIAAVALVLLGMGWMLATDFGSAPAEQKVVALDKAFPSDKAVLNLGNGEFINLSDAKVGVVYDDPGMKIVKVCETEIKYAVKNGEGSGRYANHTLTTPNGQHYKVELSDGTKIWLNAGSSLKFPDSFASLNTRNVSLTGEAYFEVASRKYQPFIVAAKDQEIQVLGTHFNVNAYRNERTIKTTLLEGSVRVTDKILMQTVLLKPQQQAVLVGDRLSVTNVSAEESASWKDGEFIFRNMPLEDIMRVIERQYNVKVVYQKTDSKESLLGGSIQFSSKLTDVLNMLELTSNAHFKIEGKQVNVM